MTFHCAAIDRRHVRLKAAVLIASSLLAACTDDGHGPTATTSVTSETALPPADPPSGNVQTTVDDEPSDGAAELADQPASTYPVEYEWRESVPTLATLEILNELTYEAWQQRTAACMQERGFEHAPVQYFDERRDEFYRAMNPLNEAAARTWGFHAPPTPEPVNPNHRSDSAYLTALGGTDDGTTIGCASIAFAEVYAPLQPLFDDLQALLNAQYEAIDGYWSTEAGTQAAAAWRTCMSQHGYNFATRDDAIGLYISDEAASPDELAARHADLECDTANAITQDRSDWERERFDDWLQRSAAQWAELEPRISDATDELTATGTE